MTKRRRRSRENFDAGGAADWVDLIAGLAVFALAIAAFFIPR